MRLCGCVFYAESRNARRTEKQTKITKIAMKQYIQNNIRIWFLSRDIVRLEVGKKGVFCDKDTLLVASKSAFDGEDAEVICQVFLQSECLLGYEEICGAYACHEQSWKEGYDVWLVLTHEIHCDCPQCEHRECLV